MQVQMERISRRKGKGERVQLGQTRLNYYIRPFGFLDLIANNLDSTIRSSRMELVAGEVLIELGT